ncbi:MAG: zf-HC2 domain-containing protein [Ignavibacteria bacterium]
MNNDITEKNNCEKTEQLIDDYLEGMISLSDKELIDEHIAECAGCSEYFSGTSELIKKVHSLPSDPAMLSAQKKSDMWVKVESNIDTKKYEKEKALKLEDDLSENKPNFFSQYKYYLSGIAAVLLIAAVFYGVKNLNVSNDRLSQQSTFGMDTYWKVSNLQGTPLIGDLQMSSNDSIKEGQWIQTNYDSRAELLVADLGKVIIEPNSKVIFVKGVDGNNRILVEYGTINTNMNSLPETFYVEMPSAVASDRGGAYTLTIDSTGDGLVYVRSGKIEVQSPNTAVIIPAGNLVMTRKDFGVGTPFNENSSVKFKSALYNLDFGKCEGACVNSLLNNAKISDAISLVNLIPKVENEYKDDFYTKVANFVTPPKNVHRDSIPFMNEEDINEWVDKIQIEVQENVAKSLKAVEKNLEEMKKTGFLKMDSIHDLENFAKNWKFKIKTHPDGNYKFEGDTIYNGFNSEEFKKEMEEAQKELKENSMIDQNQLKLDMEELREDLKEMQKELKEDLNFNNEEFRKEMEKAKEEMKKAMKEVEKGNLETLEDLDTTGYKHRLFIKSKNDKDKENVESPETPELPESPESPGKPEGNDK